jgi:hypothetical protein
MRSKIGTALSALVIAFLLFDSTGKLLVLEPVREGSAALGYPESTIFGVGVILLLSTLLYAIPRTSVLGAILLTAYLGGATASHVRVGDGLFPLFFSVGFGCLVWLGIFLREQRLSGLVPLRQTQG